MQMVQNTSRIMLVKSNRGFVVTRIESLQNKCVRPFDFRKSLLLFLQYVHINPLKMT